MVSESGQVVAVVGGGQLGSRYLQGLAACDPALEVIAVDPDPGSLRTCRSRWSEVGGEESSHRLALVSAITDLPTRVDLAVVATNAAVRPAVVEGLSGHAKVEAWLLEKVLAQSLGDLDRITQAIGRQPAWCNTWARTTPWFQQLGARLGDGPITAAVHGGSWGLACNAVHFLDLVAWWSGERLATVDGSGLDREWLAAKRPGHLEPTGRLTAHYDGGSSLTLTAAPPKRTGDVAGHELPDVLTVRTASGGWRIDGPMSETGGRATDDAGSRIDGRIEYQSERTAPLVSTILATGDCELPELSSSTDLHRRFLLGLLPKRPTIDGSSDDRVPIT